MPARTYRPPGTPKSLKVPRVIPNNHWNFSHFITVFRSKYPFLTRAQICRKAKKEWNKNKRVANTPPPPPPPSTFSSSSAEIYKFEVERDSGFSSPNLFSPGRDWKCQTYARRAKVTPKETAPEIIHAITSSQAGILRSSQKPTTSKGRVSFGKTDRVFFTPLNSSSESVANINSTQEADVYDFVADTRQIPDYDSDEDRIEQLAELHNTCSRKNAATADEEWEMIKTAPRARKITELSVQSPSTKVIQWMNDDCDPYDLENEHPTPPPSPKMKSAKADRIERYSLRSNSSPFSEQNQISTTKRKVKEAGSSDLNRENRLHKALNESKKSLPKKKTANHSKRNVQNRVDTRENELLQALHETSFLPVASPQAMNSQESLLLGSDLVEMFPEPIQESSGRRVLASSQTETESNFCTLFDDDVIFH